MIFGCDICRGRIWTPNHMKPYNMINTHILYFTKYPVTSFYDVQSLLYYTSVCSTRHSDIYIACVYIYGAFQHQLQDSGITFQSLPHSDRHSDVSAPASGKLPVRKAICKPQAQVVKKNVWKAHHGGIYRRSGTNTLSISLNADHAERRQLQLEARRKSPRP